MLADTSLKLSKISVRYGYDQWLIVENVLCGLLQFLLGLPLLNRRIPRNNFYGIRTPAALESDQRWYDINAYAGRQLVLWSVIVVSNGVTGFFIPREASDAYLVASLALVAVALAVPIAFVLRLSRAH
jgi:hypothetical protein